MVFWRQAKEALFYSKNIDFNCQETFPMKVAIFDKKIFQIKSKLKPNSFFKFSGNPTLFHEWTYFYKKYFCPKNKIKISCPSNKLTWKTGVPQKRAADLQQESEKYLRLSPTSKSQSATCNFTEIIPSRIFFKNFNHIIQKICFAEYICVCLSFNQDIADNTNKVMKGIALLRKLQSIWPRSS